MARTDNGMNKLIKIGSFSVLILGAVISIIIWVTSAFADQRDFTIEQDRVIKEELKDEAAERYVPKEEFTPVKQQLEDIKDMLKRMDRKLDRIDRQPRD